MIRNIVILLDDTAVSYCLYDNSKAKRNLISLDTLKKAIKLALLENYTVHLVYPSYQLPQQYHDIIDSIEHYKIKYYDDYNSDADILILDFDNFQTDFVCVDDNISYVLKVNRYNLFANYEKIKDLINKSNRLNIIITDIDEFRDDDFIEYQKILSNLTSYLVSLYKQDKKPSLNILTDRIHLKKMNNCNAGTESITLAPNGNFYICPAFYYSENKSSVIKQHADYCSCGYDVGNIDEGIKIINSNLYKLSHAPICRNCDAYHCRRCIWLNKLKTLEVNTPSHEQCVISHI